MNRERLEKRITEHEGLRLKPYPDSKGLITIGIGRCLDRKGISKEEAQYLFQNDVDDALLDLDNHLSWYKALDDLKQEVLVEMCFQMGIGGLLEFKKFLLALQASDYKTAANEMIDSKWARTDSPNRAKELAKIIREG